MDITSDKGQGQVIIKLSAAEAAVFADLVLWSGSDRAWPGLNQSGGDIHRAINAKAVEAKG